MKVNKYTYMYMDAEGLVAARALTETGDSGSSPHVAK